VKLEHRGSAPLHLNKVKRRGMATVQFGPDGVKMIKQKWLGTSSFASLWRSSKPDDSDMALLDFEEASALADPVGSLDFALSDAVLLEDRTDTWQGQAARLLVVRPALLVAHEETSPLVTEMRIWLDTSGVPLAMERSSEFHLGPVKATQLLTFTYQQIEGRLLADEVREDFQSTAIAVLRGRDKRTMKVRIEG
jgi:hypothetical protein